VHAKSAVLAVLLVGVLVVGAFAFLTSQPYMTLRCGHEPFEVAFLPPNTYIGPSNAGYTRQWSILDMNFHCSAADARRAGLHPPQ
jgi:hypothetical protein